MGLENAVGGLEIATQSWIQIAFTGHVARCLLMWLFFAANLSEKRCNSFFAVFCVVLLVSVNATGFSLV